MVVLLNYGPYEYSLLYGVIITGRQNMIKQGSRTQMQFYCVPSSSINTRG